jgi:DNA-binding XRE family transcriptional regulator
MTQRMLALCLGISRRSVISIETGKHQPSILHWIEFEELVKRHKEKTP